LHRKLLWTVALILAISPAASAYPFAFSDPSVAADDSGSDVFGHPWTFSIIGAVPVFGIPAVGAGFASFLGPATATDFHIRLSDVTPGVVIGDFNGFNTQFRDHSSSQSWTRVIDGDGLGVSFFAPGGGGLNPGEEFFTIVVLTGEDRTIGFEASWTADAANFG
jgi:hypothetical protein